MLPRNAVTTTAEPPLALEDALLELPTSVTAPAGAAMHIWVKTCPEAQCGCRSALVLATTQGREVLLAEAAKAAAAWSGFTGLAELLADLELARVDVVEIDIDTARASAPSGSDRVQWDGPMYPRVAEVLERIDGETLDAIGRLWHRGKGRPDPERRVLEADRLVVAGWRPGELIAFDGLVDTRRDLYELDDRMFEARELYSTAADRDGAEVVVDFQLVVPRGGPAPGHVSVAPDRSPMLAPRRNRDRHRELLCRLWGAFERRHPRYRDRFGRRLAFLRAIGSRIVVHEPRTQRSGPAIARNRPCPCGSSRKYKLCCGAAQPRS